MKKLLVLSSLLFSLGTLGQQRDTVFINRFPKSRCIPAIKLNPVNGDTARIVLANGNHLIVLSQDHMPCVVPDLSLYNMPVVKPPKEFTIPNPAYPPPVLRRKPLLQ